MFVGAFGGVFEANKLFTSLFALPLAVPFIAALLIQRPDTTGAIVSIIAGVATALLLHMGNWLSWELSTLLVVVASTASPWLASRDGRRILPADSDSARAR